MDLTDVRPEMKESIPDHPVWCPQSRFVPPYAQRHEDYLHRGTAFHAEGQDYEVGISAGMCQYDEAVPGGRREINQPRLEVVLTQRLLDVDPVTCELTLAEAKSWRDMLSHAISTVERHCERPGPARTLGWTPKVSA